MTGASSAKEMGLENQWSQPQPTKRQAPDPGGEAATERAEGKGERSEDSGVRCQVFDLA